MTHPIIRGIASGLLVVLVLAMLALALVACAGVDIEPCNGSPYSTIGPCSVGRAHDD